MLNAIKKKFNHDKEMYIRVKINPNRAVSQIKDLLADDTIKIDIAAAPEKNKANKALIKLLADEFTVDISHVTIISGVTDRVKLIKIIK